MRQAVNHIENPSSPAEWHEGPPLARRHVAEDGNAIYGLVLENYICVSRPQGLDVDGAGLVCRQLGVIQREGDRVYPGLLISHHVLFALDIPDVVGELRYER